MTDGDVVVLGSQLAALIVVLHNDGLVSASAIKAQMAAAVDLQPEYRKPLQDALVRFQLLIDALGPFVPRNPNASKTD
jgi:hypothetical protein